MSGDLQAEHSPRARPVADDGAVDALLARTDELARRWVIALVLARPLSEMAEVPLEDLARDAPSLCAQVIRALVSDAELQRLAAGGEWGGRDVSTQVSRLAAVAGARDPRDAIEVVEALRGVLWEALLEGPRSDQSGWAPAGFDRSTARLVADLADRLAHVCTVALASMLTQSTAVSVQGAGPPPPFLREEAPYSSIPRSERSHTAVLVDERSEARSPGEAEGAASAERRADPPEAGVEPVREHPHDPPESQRRRSEARPRPRPWDGPPHGERPLRRAFEERAEGSPRGEGSGPVMRVTRLSAAPKDERS